MFYKPNFCCSCGEKIDRTDWTLFTSRRFCPLCESENLGHEYFIRGLVIAGSLIGLFGVAAMLGGQAGADDAKAVQARPSAVVTKAPPTAAVKSKQLVTVGPGLTTPPEHAEVVTTDSASSAPARSYAGDQRTTASEPVYYCQAITRKGTRCTRRVKSPGFCWQHARGLDKNTGLKDR